MNNKKIIITGGPGTGKTSLINQLKKFGYYCFDEISRQVTLDARKDGTEQLFLSDPLLFSDRLLNGRISQFKDAQHRPEHMVFLDRGIPDIVAYMKFAENDYPDYFHNACLEYKYDQIFILAPWQEIFLSDNERYETFDEALQIHSHLLTTYKHYNYELIDVPFENIEKRTEFILNSIKS